MATLPEPIGPPGGVPIYITVGEEGGTHLVGWIGVPEAMPTLLRHVADQIERDPDWWHNG